MKVTECHSASIQQLHCLKDEHTHVSRVAIENSTFSYEVNYCIRSDIKCEPNTTVISETLVMKMVKYLHLYLLTWKNIRSDWHFKQNLMQVPGKNYLKKTHKTYCGNAQNDTVKKKI